MLPSIEGVIARRLLLNFRVDPEVAQALMPESMQVRTVKGKALLGVCLLRMEETRPAGLPRFVGVSSENMAHRYAVQFPHGGETEDAVFIPRRDTDGALFELVGGRLFPGYACRSEFRVQELDGGLAMNVRTEGGVADVHVRVRWTERWQGSALFDSIDEASEFFRSAPCGFNPARDGRTLEGLRLVTDQWSVEPVQVDEVRSSFYEDRNRFPAGSIEFDHALIMQGVPHRWYPVREVPEVAGRAFQ